jgi:DNA-binding CsgD family transcriptional regulator
MSQTDPVEPGRWPFTGREEQTEQVTTALRARAGRGVVLAGGAGVGRSRLAAEAARTFGPMQRVVGTRCGAALPFSAFAGLLSPGGGAVDPIREVAAALRRPPGQERPVLVVDDAHLLDPESAALVHHLAVRREVRLVVTVRDGEPAPDGVVALWKDDLLRRLEVPPLTHDDLARVLNSALAGHVEARAVRRLTAIAGGDLRMIKELVLAGTLTHRDGVWGWPGRPVVNGRVRELVANRLGDLDAAEWDALTYLAFGAPLAPWTLARLAGPETLERLEAKGLLTCAGGAPYAEVIRAMCGPVRAMRVRRTLAEAEPQDERAALWRLDGGRPGDPAALMESCRRAIAALDVPLAVRLGRAAVAAGGEEDATAALDLEKPPHGEAGRRLRAEHERLTAAVLAGDLTAEPLLGADAEWDAAAAAYCGQRARLHRLRGEVRQALASGRDGAWRLPGGPCLGEVAHAAGLLGDAATARRALAEAEAEDRRPPAQTAVELAAPWVEAAAGDQAAAVRRALAAADRTDDAEVVLFSLHSVVRLGAAEAVAGRLRPLAGGTLASLFARHAEACAGDDGAALHTVAREFEVLGLTLYAAEAQAQAARAYRRAGEHRQAKAAAATGWTLSRRCEGARTPALAELTAPELTLRQLEIARLAAAGLSNRAIAERLTVSIRTVANHLCGAYERLGVNDRAGLARLLAGLERRVA